jgi:predicted amidohydrolase YtcJ
MGGLQAGFHVNGDRANDRVREALQGAAEDVGRAALRAAGHRMEPVEMPDAAGLAVLADLGVAASVQPAFDAEWGGPDGVYARRLGVVRAVAMNPFGSMLAAGIRLAFGSDSPVTPWRPGRASGPRSTTAPRRSA